DTLDVLRLGAFQLLRLDKIPAHAAVETTVSVGRRLGGQRVAGFVNAVLRRVAAGASTEQPTPRSSDVATLAREYSHPEWLVDRWVGAVGVERTELRLAADNRRPRLIVQPNGGTQAELAAFFTEQGVTTEPAPWDSGLVVPPARPTELPGFRTG